MKPHITFKYSDNRRLLTLEVDKTSQGVLSAMRGDQSQIEENLNNGWGSEMLEVEILEQMLANSELDWVSPIDTGDLTDAPMLGIRDEYGDLIERWGYPHYASPWKSCAPWSSRCKARWRG